MERLQSTPGTPSTGQLGQASAPPPRAPAPESQTTAFPTGPSGPLLLPITTRAPAPPDSSPALAPVPQLQAVAGSTPPAQDNSKHPCAGGLGSRVFPRAAVFSALRYLLTGSQRSPKPRAQPGWAVPRCPCPAWALLSRHIPPPQAGAHGGAQAGKTLSAKQLLGERVLAPPHWHRGAPTLRPDPCNCLPPGLRQRRTRHQQQPPALHAGARAFQCQLHH